MIDKYIYHVPKEDHLVGILHLRNNLFALLMEAKYLNRVAIVPPLHLNGKHNNGIPVISTWNKYIILNNIQSFHPFICLSDYGHIDFEKCRLINEHIKPSEMVNESSQLLVRKHIKYPNYYMVMKYFSHKNWKNELMNLIQPSEPVAKFADIAKTRMKKYHCIHIRRGDKLKWKQCPGLDRKTQPKYLKKFLEKIIPKGEKLYIMSNEKKRDFFKPLKESFTIFTYHDFPQFDRISKSDNYLLFSIENEIMNNAITKIRTFKEDDYLSILNYPPNGVELLSSRIMRRLVLILRRLNIG